MEDATTAILDFRDNLPQELAELVPEVNSFFGVGHFNHTLHHTPGLHCHGVFGPVGL